jgi:hypothetical protein
VLTGVARRVASPDETEEGRMPVATHRTMSDEDVARVLELARKSDGVELKLTVPASDHDLTIRALDLDPLEARIRQVFFFDTPGLDLHAAGIVARARRIQGKGGDAVVKLRPVDPDDPPTELRESEDFVVEVDAMPSGYVCSASLKRAANAGTIREAAFGRVPVRKLFSKAQRRFVEANAPFGIDFDCLAILGPIFVLKVKFAPEAFARRLVAELWLYPNGARILELSTKCDASDAFQVAAELRALLNGHGLGVAAKQETKTKAALTYFSKHLTRAHA